MVKTLPFIIIVSMGIVIVKDAAVSFVDKKPAIYNDIKMKKLFFILFTGILITGCTPSYQNITVITPDLTQFNDGVYRGVHDLSGTPVDVTLDVNIKNNKISNIEIVKHVCSPIGKKAENIIETVIEKQSLEIDAVSGATASSKAILKAIENALQ